MRRNYWKHYFLILLYGILLLIFMLGTGNLYGSNIDWLNQHIVFPDTFRQAFYESGQLFPNFLFQIGGGQNIFHFIYYGFLSPGILLSYLLPFVDMTTYIIGFSICSYLISGCLVYHFLSTHFEDNISNSSMQIDEVSHNKFSGSFFKNIAFGAAILFLSLSPITYHFHHHIMFVWFLPFFLLSLIGLDRYFSKKKYGLFIVSVVGMIMTNYYFSVGGLVFLFIYAIYCILQMDTLYFVPCQNTNGHLPFIKFAKSTSDKIHIFYWTLFLKQIGNSILLFLIPVLLCGFLLLPTAYTLFSNERTSTVSLDMQNLFLPSFEEYFYDSYGMGISAVMLLAVMGNLSSGLNICFNRVGRDAHHAHKAKYNNVSLPSVIADIFLNVFLLFVLICPFFIYILNGMLYVRGKVLIACSILFLYSFCLFLQKIKNHEIHLRLSIALSVGFIVLFTLLRKGNWQIGVCLLIELAILCLFRKWQITWFLYPVIISVFISCRANTEESYVTKDYYEEMYYEEIAELMEHTEGDFYRSNVMYRENYMANKISGENFYGTSVYSSTSNRLYQDFYETYMGNNERYRNCFITSGARNELFYNFMGTKYIVSKEDPGLYYEKIASDEHLNLYKSPYAYPVVYKSTDLVSESQFDKLEFPYTAECLMKYTIISDISKNTNTSVSKVNTPADIKSSFQKIEVPQEFSFMQETKDTYTISLDETYQNKIIYLTFEIMNEGAYQNKQDISISINGIKNTLTAYTWMYYNGNTTFDYVLPMENRTDLEITITKGKYDIQNLKMYLSDMIYTDYEEATNLVIDTYNDRISCNINGKAGEYLVTTVPYDKGFSAYINGEKTEVEIVNKAFVGVPLTNGENHIIITYTSPLLKEGIIVSCIGVLLLIHQAVIPNILRRYSITSLRFIRLN